jgi:hypothetical protein
MLTGWGTDGGTVASSAATAVLLPAPVLRPVVEVAGVMFAVVVATVFTV